MMRFIVAIIASMALAVPGSAASAQTRADQEARDEATARVVLAQWAGCVVDDDPAKVERILDMDFRTRDYQRKLNGLGQRDLEDCLDGVPAKFRSISATGLPFAGAMAEHLIEREEEPLLNRLGMATVGTIPETYSSTDAMAQCIVRGAPHLVAVLFDSELNSAEELVAISDLMPIAEVCLPGDRGLEGSATGMRSILATAAFRLLYAQRKTDA